MVRYSLLLTEKRMFQKGEELKEMGLSNEKAVTKFSGPTPRKAVRQLLNISTAIVQPVVKGSKRKVG